MKILKIINYINLFISGEFEFTQIRIVLSDEPLAKEPPIKLANAVTALLCPNRVLTLEFVSKSQMITKS